MDNESFDSNSTPLAHRGTIGHDPSGGISRRSMLKNAVGVLGAGLLPSRLHGAILPASERTKSMGVSSPGTIQRGGKTPITLMIDDGGPVDQMYYMHPGYETPLVIPLEFCQRFAGILEKYEVHGKMTVLPMQSCLGRLDQSLKMVPQKHLESFLQIVRDRVATRLDITPEFLTHLYSWNLKATNFDLNQDAGYTHFFEDTWISAAPPAEVAEYFTLAFTILKNVGINSTGMTSPWSAGIDAESKYARAVSDAQWGSLGRATTWYFLHDSEWGPPQQITIGYQTPSLDRVVVSIPGNFPDIFWSMDVPREQRAKFVRDNIDKMLSPDGRTGRIRDLLESGHPLTLLTHWQSLWTQGTQLGLDGLSALLQRIQSVLGGSIEWVACSELAERYVSASRKSA